MMELSSFDIFDTTLLRTCGRAENVIALLAMRLFPDDRIMQHDFILWRNKAPKRIEGEYSLADIYKVKGVDAFDKYYSPIELMALEMQTESDLLTGNADVINKINECRIRGHQIAFISDMYLPTDFLKQILIREGAFQDGDGLFISNEMQARKDQGSLFDLVSETYKPIKWTHYGDNWDSDNRIPQSKGINTVFIDEDYNEIEKELISRSALLPYPYELSILGGICRSARKKFCNTNEAMMAADFVASAYIPFVMQVLNDAKKRGIRTLFFVSRDGYIFHKIADRLPHDSNIEFRYLFLSRQSLHKAFFHIATDEELRETKLQNEKDSSVNYAEYYNNCIGYLRQEGALESDIAIVDLGWFGSSRLMLNSIRAANNKEQLMTYYWGVVPNIIDRKYGDYVCYSQDSNVSTWQTFVMEEYFSACPWPSAVGYVKENDSYKPIFEQDSEYKEDYVTLTNREVCVYIADIISRYKFDEHSLYLWMTMNLDKLLSGDLYIDWTEFSKRSTSKEFFIRKLSLKETFDYVIYHEKFKVTNIDACLDLSWGFRWRNRVKKGRAIYFCLYNIKQRLKKVLRLDVR